MINPDYSSAIFNKTLIYMKQANSDDFEKTIDQYIVKMKAVNDEAKIKQASHHGSWVLSCIRIKVRPGR